jgi:hypothetical protein
MPWDLIVAVSIGAVVGGSFMCAWQWIRRLDNERL